MVCCSAQIVFDMSSARSVTCVAPMQVFRVFRHTCTNVQMISQGASKVSWNACAHVRNWQPGVGLLLERRESDPVVRGNLGLPPRCFTVKCLDNVYICRCGNLLALEVVYGSVSFCLMYSMPGGEA
jgi:hypothetical protein